MNTVQYIVMDTVSENYSKNYFLSFQLHFFQNGNERISLRLGVLAWKRNSKRRYKLVFSKNETK